MGLVALMGFIGVQVVFRMVGEALTRQLVVKYDPFCVEQTWRHLYVSVIELAVVVVVVV